VEKYWVKRNPYIDKGRTFIMSYKPEDDGAYRFEISSPTYADAFEASKLLNLDVRQWNWNPSGGDIIIKDKRPWEGL